VPNENDDAAHADRSNLARQLYDESKSKVSSEEDNLGTIREILFGEQTREAEKRRHDTHHTLQSNIAELKQETQDQFEFLSAEISKLYELINNESESRLNDKKDGKQLIDKIQVSMEQAKTRQTTENTRLHQQVLNESSRLEQHTAKQHEELSQKLDQASLELRSDKTNRSDLAKLLQGMAEQLLDTSKK